MQIAKPYLKITELYEYTYNGLRIALQITHARIVHMNTLHNSLQQ